jgi:hypothetical protein
MRTVRWVVGRLRVGASFGVVAVLIACGRLPDAVPAPTSIAADAGPGYVRVVWDHPGGAASGFEVLRVGAGAPQVVGSVAADRRSFVDLGGTAGTDGRYAVRALDDRGEPGPATAAEGRATPASAVGDPPGDNPDEQRFLAVVVLDHLGNGLPGSDVVAAVRPPGRQVELLEAVSGDDGVALLADLEGRPELAGIAGGFVWVTPPRGAGVAPLVRFVDELAVPGTWVADPEARDLVDLVGAVRHAGAAGNHLLQLVGEVEGALVVGGVVDVSRVPTVLRVGAGAYDAVVTGYVNGPGVGTHVWSRVEGGAPMRLAVDTTEAGAVPLAPSYLLGGPGTVVSAFLCPNAQRPAVATLRAICVGDATVLLTPQRYALGAVVRARTDDVDWIYTYALNVADVDGAAGAPEVGADVTLTAEAVARGDGTWAIRGAVADASGNGVTSVMRREDGVSVPVAARAELRDDEGFLVDVRRPTLETLADWAYAPPADAPAGRYTLTLRLAAGPLASRPLRSDLRLDVGGPTGGVPSQPSEAHEGALGVQAVAEQQLDGRSRWPHAQAAGTFVVPQDGALRAVSDP